jgi:hypothetical protein
MSRLCMIVGEVYNPWQEVGLLYNPMFAFGFKSSPDRSPR